MKSYEQLNQELAEAKLELLEAKRSRDEELLGIGTRINIAGQAEEHADGFFAGDDSYAVVDLIEQIARLNPSLRFSQMPIVMAEIANGLHCANESARLRLAARERRARAFERISELHAMAPTTRALTESERAEVINSELQAMREKRRVLPDVMEGL